jgi:fructose-1,6-bisphosphatase/inositol monophosphatase family enzyme
MTAPNLTSILPDAVALVREAGTWLAAEFCRPGGPRSSDTDTSPIDTEIELFLRDRLTRLLPARFVGEEEGVLAADANGYCWVVDPHDGTRAFLEGKRGSAVSVGLLHQGVPVLGVVYAPTSPDRGPDMIAWAEGGPMTRNGETVGIDLSQRDLTDSDVVFLNHGAGERPIWNSTACAPARFMPLPSIAYRLARVAAGDGIATVTMRPVNAHDIAAGHALLRAAGGVLVAEDGQPVTYDHDGASRPSACFGGAPHAVGTLRTRTWRRSTEPRRIADIVPNWPRAAEDSRFDRALGCMLGMLIGDGTADGISDDAATALWLARHLIETGEIGAGPFPSACAVPLAIWAPGPQEARQLGGLAFGDTPDARLTRALAAAIGGSGRDQAENIAGRPHRLLDGALLGRSALPAHVVLRLLTDRPDPELHPARPRPDAIWPDRVLDLTEALLLSRRA